MAKRNNVTSSDLTNMSSALLMRWMEHREIEPIEQWTAADVQTMKEIWRIGLSEGGNAPGEDLSHLSDEDIERELELELNRFRKV